MNIRRVAIAILIGFAGTIICYLYQLSHGNSAGDAWIPLCMGRALLRNVDPYDVCRSVHSDGVTPATANPLTAGLAMLPLTPLPDPVAASVLIGLSSGLLAFALTRNGTWQLLVFLALPYWESLRWVQWPPLLMAVALIPSLLPLTLIKPHVGLPIVLTRLTLRRALACAAFGIISLLVDPTWPARWLEQTSHYTGFIPLLVLPGPLLLLAGLRWRDADARFLLLMAVVPQRIFYDQLLLWLIPRTPHEMLVLTALSWLPYFISFLYPNSTWISVVTLIYGVTLVLVLRRSPTPLISQVQKEPHTT